MCVFNHEDSCQPTLSGSTPSHGLFRVQSSHIMTPRLKISHFSVKGSLRISSGAIHSGVPADEESLMGESVIILDSPKSHILTVQCLFTRQFALFKSRWTIFIRCTHIKPLISRQQKIPVNIQQKIFMIFIQLQSHESRQPDPFPYLI